MTAPSTAGTIKGGMPEGINKDYFSITQSAESNPVIYLAARIITSGLSRTAWITIFRPEFNGAREGSQHLRYPIKPRVSEVTIQNRMFDQASTLITHGTIYWTWPGITNIVFNDVDGKDGPIHFVEIAAEENPAAREVKSRIEEHYRKGF